MAFDPMTFDNEPLVLDLVEWVGKEPRPYQEVMNAWRTSCPRLQIWEDAVDHGLLTRYTTGANQPMVKITAKGREFLENHDRVVTTPK